MTHLYRITTRRPKVRTTIMLRDETTRSAVQRVLDDLPEGEWVERVVRLEPDGREVEL